MISFEKVLSLLNLQIKKKGVDLPKKTAVPKTIKHNNQAIFNGAIDEKSKTDVRSQTKHGNIPRRGKDSHRED